MAQAAFMINEEFLFMQLNQAKLQDMYKSRIFEI